jgi:glutamyl-tRNA synthetase
MAIKMSNKSENQHIKVRFAPAPSGFIHPGNARSAIMNYVLAKSHPASHDSFILRIDDTNEEKVSTEAVDGLLNDLKWLEIVPDKIEQQSKRFELYKQVFEILKKHNVIYPCNQYKSNNFSRIRRENCEVQLKNDENDSDYGWRFEIKEGQSIWNDMILGDQIHDPIKMSSDPIVFREGGQITYLLASAIDDIFMGITHIIRGQDHVSNTAIQVQMIHTILNVILAENATELLEKVDINRAKHIKFGHLPLLSFEDGQKLSKRNNSLSIKSLREDGILPVTINNYLLSLGTNNISEFSSNQDILDHFASINFDEFFGSIGKASAMFSMQNLLHLNQKILTKMEKNDIVQHIQNQNENDAKYINNLDDNAWNLIRENVFTLNDIISWLDVLYDDEMIYCNKLAQYLEQYDDEYDLCDFFQIAVDKIQSMDTKSPDAWNDFSSYIKEKTGKKGVQLFMPIRIALTGKEHGPKMNLLFDFMKKNTIIHRFKECIV